MTQESTPFDHRPDAALGAALREALAPGDHAAFIARVLAGLEAPRAGHWEVLASWARAGIAAAAVAAFAAGILAGRAMSAPAFVDDLLASAAGPSARELVAAALPPDPSVVLVSAEER
jgi:hypothetical protein